MGTFTHDGNMQMILSTLHSVLRSRRDKVELQFISNNGGRTLEAFGDLPVRVLRVDPRCVGSPRFIPWIIANICL